jgi:hypothetical protein
MAACVGNIVRIARLLRIASSFKGMTRKRMKPPSPARRSGFEVSDPH